MLVQGRALTFSETVIASVASLLRNDTCFYQAKMLKSCSTRRGCYLFTCLCVKLLLSVKKKPMNRITNTLKEIEIFYKLTPAQLEMIAGLCQEETHQAGEIVFNEGAHGDELYIILEGAIDILIDTTIISSQPEMGAHPITVNTLRRGQSFGEIALVDRGLRSATARAAQDNTHLLKITRAELLNLCETDPRLGYQLMYNLAADLAFKTRSIDFRVRQEHLQAGES